MPTSIEHDHDDHLQGSYITCECGHDTCTGNMDTCPCCGSNANGPPGPPTLYSIPSPDVDGIIPLQWSSVSRATSYNIFRSDARFGTYTLIATTSSPSYTDTTTDGTWWYYIKAHNNDGNSDASNKESVIVYLPPEPTILIGSTQRFFPHEDTSRLGFTIYSVFANSIPEIEFSITETDSYSGEVSIKIKIDMVVVWSTNVDMDFTDVFQSQFDQLSTEGTHQIIIQVSNGAGPNNIYFLEYLKIHNLHLRESEVYNQVRYSPVYLYTYDTYLKDYATVSICSRLPFDNNELKSIGVNELSFGPSLIVTLDPDVEHHTSELFGLLQSWQIYYIHSTSFRWKVISPDGTYLERYEGGSQVDRLGGDESFVGVHEGAPPDDFFDEILFIIDTLGSVAFTLLLPDYISIPLDVMLEI